MLDPQTRAIYLSALRPPEGYTLDRALAATFSLDLLSLLMAPMSMILLEEQDKDALLSDPIAALEALRRTAGRLLVFCQAGRIAVPAVDSRLYSYLEPAVVEVQPRGKGVFHPKFWLLRFASEGDDRVKYRLLCLSRNLTFDRSWDTLLSLEGDLAAQRQRNFGLNRPLVDMVQSLPGLALNSLSALAQSHVETIAAEIGRVRFEPPPGFQTISAFIPSGIRGHKKLALPAERSRLLVMSPFLSDGWLQALNDYRREKNVLISRRESLDALKPETLARLESGADIYVMQESAERPEETDDKTPAPGGDDLSGLHAKLYIVEDGRQATVLSGSANATHAAFEGRNIEFMTQLAGKRSAAGIEAFLGQADGEASLRSMLQPYQRPAGDASGDPSAKKLETLLDQGRRALVNGGLELIVSPAQSNTFDLVLRATHLSAETFRQISGRCAPISLDFSRAQEISPLLSGARLTFARLSLIGLTGFIAFELKAKLQNQRAAIRFVLNLPVKGMPPDRNQAILRSVISNKQRFLRYLLFLLAEENDAFQMQSLLASRRDTEPGAERGALSGLPLLEELVRAASRRPEKIDRIAKLVESLRQTEAGRALLPEDFAQIWDAFLSLRPSKESRQ